MFTKGANISGGLCTCDLHKLFNCGFTNNEWDTCEIVTLAAFNYKTS